MADLPRRPDSGTDLGTSHDHGSTTGKRRWGTTLAVMLGVGVVVLVVVLHLTGTVGPGAH